MAFSDGFMKKLSYLGFGLLIIWGIANAIKYYEGFQPDDSDFDQFALYQPAAQLAMKQMPLPTIKTDSAAKSAAVLMKPNTGRPRLTQVNRIDTLNRNANIQMRQRPPTIVKGPADQSKLVFNKSGFTADYLPLVL